MTLAAAIGTAAALFSFLVVGGCAHDPPLPDGPGVERFELVSVDGKPLPTTVQHGRFPVRVYAGAFRIAPNGDCGSSSTFGEPEASERLVRHSICTYVRDGDDLKMAWKGAGGTTGTIDGDSFTMDNHGTIFVYRREPLR